MTSTSRIPEKLALKILFLLSLIYVFFSLGLERSFREFSYLLFILIIAYTIKYQRQLFKTPPFYFLIAATLIAVITWLLTFWQVPHIGSSSPRLGDILDKFSFLPLAVLLMGNTKRTFVFWIVAAIGALLTPWFSGNGLTRSEEHTSELQSRPHLVC